MFSKELSNTRDSKKAPMCLIYTLHSLRFHPSFSTAKNVVLLKRQYPYILTQQDSHENTTNTKNVCCICMSTLNNCLVVREEKLWYWVGIGIGRHSICSISIGREKVSKPSRYQVMC